MNKPTVTVTPDDGSGGNKVEVSLPDGSALGVVASRVNLGGGYDDVVKRGLYHAIERIAELEAERDYLVNEYERATGCGNQGFTHAAGHIYNAIVNARCGANANRIVTLMNERDALAAHVEAIKAAWSEPAERHAQTVDGVFAVLERGPQTSLAQRDARMKAEALEGMAARLWPVGMIGKGEERNALLLRATEYRQQAEENNQ